MAGTRRRGSELRRRYRDHQQLFRAVRVPAAPDAGVTALVADFPLGLGRNGQMTVRQYRTAGKNPQSA